MKTFAKLFECSHENFHENIHNTSWSSSEKNIKFSHRRRVLKTNKTRAQLETCVTASQTNTDTNVDTDTGFKALRTQTKQNIDGHYLPRRNAE